jgi:cytidine deaminase
MNRNSPPRRTAPARRAGPARRARGSAPYRPLLLAAQKARRHAYAPYSKFRVGAALLTASGKVYTGANVENASYGLTLCAERVALTKAVSEGHKKFRALAIVAPSTALSPCGACRQVLAEFGDMLVLCADSRDARKVRQHRLSELLPDAFRL